MIHRTFSTLLLGLILLSMLSACAPVRVASEIPVLPDGQVISMQVGSTWYGIRQAFSGAPNAKLMSNGSQVAAIWNAGEAWCVAFLNADAQKPLKEFVEKAGGKGGVMNARTISDLTKWMEVQGWKVIAPASLPVKLKVFSNISKEAFITLAKALPTPLIIIPAGVTDITEQFLFEYTGNDGEWH